ncbi:uncharacterized protein LOC114721576 [Neltuma alba]|uniref:uncharacterized protein LOC114721576 n=1 Tax=Neltuma alba TaxID=207710 RepID=UPI0010A340EE|nr:uncharacterized protein LOC114721576 [Prosopis alba]
MPQEESGDEEREWKDDLFHAISSSKWSDAKAIVDQNSDALTAVIIDQGRTTLHVAAMFGHVTIVEELLKLLPPEFLLTGDSNGDTALVLACWFSGNTQVAKCLGKRNSHILGISSRFDDLPVTVAFDNGHQELGRYLYSVTPLEYLKGHPGSKLLRVCFHAQCFGVKKIQELKLLHAQADELLRLVCKNARKAYQKGFIEEPLRLAAKEGNVEFVFQVSKVIPEICINPTFASCFNEALDYRQAKVFSLIHGLRFRHVLVTFIADDGNNLMHKEAMKAPDHVLNRIYTPTLQMQRELQWFKFREEMIKILDTHYSLNNHVLRFSYSQPYYHFSLLHLQF